MLSDLVLSFPEPWTIYKKTWHFVGNFGANMQQRILLEFKIYKKLGPGLNALI